MPCMMRLFSVRLNDPPKMVHRSTQLKSLFLYIRSYHITINSYFFIAASDSDFYTIPGNKSYISFKPHIKTGFSYRDVVDR